MSAQRIISGIIRDIGSFPREWSCHVIKNLRILCIFTWSLCHQDNRIKLFQHSPRTTGLVYVCLILFLWEYDLEFSPNSLQMIRLMQCNLILTERWNRGKEKWNRNVMCTNLTVPGQVNLWIKHSQLDNFSNSVWSGLCVYFFKSKLNWNLDHLGGGSTRILKLGWRRLDLFFFFFKNKSK